MLFRNQNGKLVLEYQMELPQVQAMLEALKESEHVKSLDYKLYEEEEGDEEDGEE